MKCQTEKMPVKMPYTAPSLIPRSISGLASRLREQDGQPGQSVEKWLLPPGSPKAPLIIEGFDGDVTDLLEVLSSTRWRGTIGQAPITEAIAPLPGFGWRGEDGIAVLLVDRRRGNSGWRGPFKQIEDDLTPSRTFVLVLIDSGEDFRVDGEVGQTDRWHFRGSVTAAGLGVFIKMMCEIWPAWTETLAKSSSTRR